MSFLIDHRIHPHALKALEKLDAVIPFFTRGITYPALSGHPDVFCCAIPEYLVVSAAVPDSVCRALNASGVAMVQTAGIPGDRYPASAVMNAVVTEQFLVHRTDITDLTLKQCCHSKEFIHVNQGYTRCNLVVLDEKLWITSDEGIARTLLSKGLKTVYADPSPVMLEGFPHGFLGGCCGVFQGKLLVNGSLGFLKEGKLLRNEVEACGYEIFELHQGPLQDVGGIFGCR